MRELKTALLISGGGTTASAVLTACKQKKLTGIDPVVIASTPDAKGIERVKRLGITTHIIDRDSFSDIDVFGEKLLQLLKKLHVKLISLQGWLPLISSDIVHAYKDMVINQHPGPLDPGRTDFGGKGMSNPYRVTCARIAYTWASGDKPWTESIVHFVEEEFDKGDFVRIAKMAIPAQKDKESIKELRENPKKLIAATHETVNKFYPIEHANIIASLQLFADEKVKGFARKTPLVANDNIRYVADAKKLAIELFLYRNL